MAVAHGPMDYEAKLARPAVCALAGSTRHALPSGTAAASTRHFRRSRLGRSGSISHERNQGAWVTACSGPLAVSGTQFADLRHSGPQTGRVFL